MTETVFFMENQYNQRQHIYSSLIYLSVRQNKNHGTVVLVLAKCQELSPLTLAIPFLITISHSLTSIW